MTEGKRRACSVILRSEAPKDLPAWALEQILPAFAKYRAWG
jgi:hypothetical protein